MCGDVFFPTNFENRGFLIVETMFSINHYLKVAPKATKNKAVHPKNLVVAAINMVFDCFLRAQVALDHPASKRLVRVLTYHTLPIGRFLYL